MERIIFESFFGYEPMELFPRNFYFTILAANFAEGRRLV